MAGASQRQSNKDKASFIIASRQARNGPGSDAPAALKSSHHVDMGVKERLTNDGNVGVNKAADKRVIINVGGTRHETWVSTLERLPGSRLALLAHLQEADEAFDAESGEYFFDRHPKAFETIIHYFRTKELHVDQSVCGNVLKGELLFWGIEEHEIEACCWATYSKYTEHKDTLEELDENFAYVTGDAWSEPVNSFKNRMWRFLEEPGSSRGAKVYAVISMFMVALSIATFVLETHPLFQVDSVSGRPMQELVSDDNLPTGGKLQCCCNNPVNAAKVNLTWVPDPDPHIALQVIDYICISFFTLELIIRFAFAPLKCKFWRQPLNIIDFVCLIPHFVSIGLNQFEEIDDTSHISRILKTILMMRVIRILRIFKLMKHYNAFKILVYTIKVSTKELLLMIVFLMTGVLMFASIIHYAEQDNFPNIPIGIWWALVTMTTVGYGDKYPVGYVGFGTGSICVICGVLVIAFTVPIVVNNFSLYYSHAQTRIKIPHQKKKKKTKEELIREQQMQQRHKPRPPPHPPQQHKQKVWSTGDAVEDQFASLHSPRDNKSVSNSTEMLIYPDKGQPTSRKKRVLSGADDNKPPPAPAVKERPPPPTRKTSTPLTARDVEVEDLDSLDSGFDDREKKFEEESKRIMESMMESNTRHADERRRQEWLIRQKREARERQRRAGRAPQDHEPDTRQGTKQNRQHQNSE